MPDQPRNPDDEVTLNTIRDWAERSATLLSATGHSAGYSLAARDVLAILAAHGRPPGEPVVLNNQTRQDGAS